MADPLWILRTRIEPEAVVKMAPQMANASLWSGNEPSNAKLKNASPTRPPNATKTSIESDANRHRRGAR